jgi:hypothetical protein
MCWATFGQSWAATWAPEEHEVAQASLQVSPITYQAPDLPITRTVGRLRRLAIAIVRFEYKRRRSFDLGEAALRPEIEWEDQARAFLTSWKGYEVEEFPYSRRRRSTASRVAEWAARASPGDIPPADLQGRVGRLARNLCVDGFVVIRGRADGLERNRTAEFFRRMSTIMIGLPAEQIFTIKLDVTVDVIQAHDAAIVWRSQLTDEITVSSDELLGSGPETSLRQMEVALYPIEPAVPEIFVDDATGACAQTPAADDALPKE